MKRMLLAAALATAVLGAHSASAAVSIVNGSFESGPNPGAFATLGAGNTSITGWLVGGQGVDYIGSYWQAADGTRSIDLSGNGPGSISQTLTGLDIGQAYDVNFWMAGNPDGGGATKVEIVSAGISQSQTYSFLQGANTKANMGWTPRDFVFTADSTSEVLTFAATQPNAFGPALDQVSIHAVPEPATWAMMIFGFGAVGSVLRRRQRTALA